MISNTYTIKYLKFLKYLMCLVYFPLWLVSCASDLEIPNSENVSFHHGTGVALSTQVASNTDVAYFRYKVETCDNELKYVSDVAISDIVLPGDIPRFLDTPFDGQSTHIFADHYIILPEGCYNITVTPITEYDYPSTICRTITAYNVEVLSDQTTELMLISQCDSDSVGGLDIVAALNHPPQFTQLEYYPSKFVGCNEKVRICTTAQDFDRDPIGTVWKQVAGPTVVPAAQIVESQQYGDNWRECLEFRPKYGGSYAFEVLIYDKFPTSSQQDQQAIEGLIDDWFSGEDYDLSLQSVAALEVPLHSSCPRTACGVACEDQCVGRCLNDPEPSICIELCEVLCEMDDDDDDDDDDHHNSPSCSTPPHGH